MIGNLVLLDYFFAENRAELLDFQTRLTQLAGSFRAPGPEKQAAALPAQLISASTCPQSCLNIISLATQAAVSRQPILALPAPVTLTAGVKEYFIPLGNGATGKTPDWVTVDSAQAKFNAGNFGTIKAAYFEVFLHAQAGEAGARLFDTTTPALFFGSELKTASTGSVFLSAPIALTPGEKVYKVQMTSTLSNGFLDQARIRIVAQ